MDELDAKIIATLRQNGRASNAGIARSAGVSEGTVRRRLRRLIDEEHIFVAAIPNPAMMGNPFEALIGVQVDPDKADLVAAAMAVMDELSWVTVSTGTVRHLRLGDYCIPIGSERLPPHENSRHPRRAAHRDLRTSRC